MRSNRKNEQLSKPDSVGVFQLAASQIKMRKKVFVDEDRGLYFKAELIKRLPEVVLILCSFLFSFLKSLLPAL